LNGVTPLVKRRHSLDVTAVLLTVVYVLSATVSAAAVGLVVGYAGLLSPEGELTSFVVMCMLGVLGMREAGWIRFRVPGLNAVVPASAVSGAPWFNALIWGLVLGAGFLTHVRFSIFWGMHLLMFTMRSPAHAAVVGGIYGLARSFPAVVLLWRPILRKKWLEPTPKLLLGQSRRLSRLGGLALMIATVVKCIRLIAAP